MKERKNSADWYVAATHWLTSGFVIPVLMNLALIYIFRQFHGSFSLLYMTNILISPLVIWLGVMYSASYINKTYVIKDPKVIAVLSTIYMVVIRGGIKIYGLTGNFNADVIIDLGVFIVIVTIFYFSSVKYVKANV